MKLNTQSFLSKLRQHHGIAIWKTMDSFISFTELVQIVDANIQIFKQLRYSSTTKEQHVVLVDVSLGWRAVAIILAAMALRITVIPIDREYDFWKTEEIRLAFPKEIVLDSSNISSTGRIVIDLIDSSKKSLYENLANVALLLYTSGTTGTPKGVMLTYQNIWSNVSDILEYFHLMSDDRLCIMRSFIHASAISGELLPALFSGCSIFIKKPNESPFGILKEMEKLSPTVLCAAPTIVGRLALMARRYKLTSLRVIVLSGEVLNRVQYQRIAKAFLNTKIWNVYGLTEASPRISYWSGDHKSFESGCVGFPLKSVKLQIVDDNGEQVPDGTEGELLVCGPNVMKGYFNAPKLTSSKYINGWFYTSDRASIRNGLLFIHGRKDDLLIRGGMNVYPTEIEEKLLLHPDVKEAFVFGKMKSNGEMGIFAWVVCKDNVQPKELYKFLIESKVSPRLWPDQIEKKPFLNHTSSGKIKRTN